MKPIVRWTISNVSNLGFEILQRSVCSLVRLYKSSFDFYVCYNAVTDAQLAKLSQLDVELVNQKLFPAPHEPQSCSWVLRPPRLGHPSTHEIFLDNDLILFKRCPKLERFIESDSVLLCEGRYGLYGKYRVNFHRKINSGIFGIPPKLDFWSAIAQAVLPFRGIPEDHFDFQGIVAQILTQYPSFILLNLDDITICQADEHLIYGKYGVHFVAANASEHHLAWINYKYNRFF